MKILIPIVFILCLGFYSCKKIAPGIKTSVHGRFYDNDNQEAYPGFVVKIAEYNSHYSYGGNVDYFSKFIDSTVTDANGNYNINFTSTGDGNSYYVSCTPPQKNKTTNKGPFSHKIDNIGNDNEYNFTMYKTYYMQARVIVHNNPFPPVYTGIVTPKVSSSDGSANIPGTNNDIVVYIPIVKNTGGFYISFFIMDPTTKVLYKNPRILQNPVIDKDTIQGGPFTLEPSTFSPYY